MLSSSGSYAQDFSLLASADASGIWDNGTAPLPAWCAWVGTNAATSFRSGSTPTAGGLWALPGPRLGFLAVHSKGIRCGFTLSNATDTVITDFSIAFTSARFPAASSGPQTLEFLYRVTNAVLPFLQGSWRRSPELSLSPGSFAAEIRVALPPGHLLSFCWFDSDDPGTDDAYAIGPVSVLWQAGDVPDCETIPLPAAGASEDFSSTPCVSGARLPPGWRVNSWDTSHITRPFALSGDSLPNAFLGDATAYLQVPCGATAFSSAELLDTAIGGVPEYEAASVTILAAFRNTSGAAYRRLDVRYAVEKYMNGMIPTEVELLVSRTGSAWQTAGETVFDGDMDNVPALRASAPTETRVVSQRVELAGGVPPGGIVYLAWRVTPVGSPLGERRQGLAIDDVYVVPAFSAATCVTIR